MSIIQKRIPELEISEMVFGTLIGDNCLKITEIPFLSRDLNYQDLVRCKPFMHQVLEGYYDFIEVIQYSGYKTIHVAFRQEVPLDDKKKIVRDLFRMGVLYRRVGLTSFAFSIGQGLDRKKALEYIKCLFIANIVVDDDKKAIGALSNVLGMLGYMFHPPKLNNGLVDDEELDFFPNQLDTPNTCSA